MRHADVDRRKQAFRLYTRYRVMSRVSKELGIPPATLHKWKKEENWDEKTSQLQDRLKGQLEVLQRAEDDLSIQDMTNSLGLLSHLEKEISEIIITQEVKPSNWRDVIQTLEYISKEKRLILGEPTNRNENTGAIDVTGMKESDLDDEINRLNKIVNSEPQETSSEMYMEEENEEDLNSELIIPEEEEQYG